MAAAANNVAICITAGEQSENHQGMEINGDGLATEGFTIEEMEDLHQRMQGQLRCEYVRLDEGITGENGEAPEPAALLILRNATEHLTGITNENMLAELMSFKWDDKYWDTRRSRVLNKRARHNVCFGDVGQAPDYENKRGTIVAFQDVPALNVWRNALYDFFGDKSANLQVEGNLYFDVRKCGVGFHGDAERKRVIACSLGASRPIHWQWYQKSKEVGPRFMFELNAGDMYVMSEKTSGYDWRRRNVLTLRHAAGTKYV